MTDKPMGIIDEQDAIDLALDWAAGCPCPYCGVEMTPQDLCGAIQSDTAPRAPSHRACWDRHIIEQKYGTYEDDEGREWINASGACRECCDGQRGEIAGRDWGQGHFLCGSVPDDILQADKAGVISGMLHNNSWRWF